MLANYNYLKVSLGIGLTWASAFIFSYGLSHATLDHEPLVYPTFQGNNFWFFIAAPIAQSAFYILARRVSWLLNIYIAISALCFTVFLYNLLSLRLLASRRLRVSPRMRRCLDFGWLVFLQGGTLMLTSSAFDDVSGWWRAGLRAVLLALLCWVFLSSLFMMVA